MEPSQSGQLGTMINTQPSQQALPDPNVASLVPQASQQGQMSPDVAKATMGNATFLASHLLPKKDASQSDGKQPGDGSTAPSEPQGDTESKKETSDEPGIETRLTKQIDELKEQITNNHQLDEISAIRKELTDLLKEDGGQK